MAGIYIHIPFCKQACYYCDFHFSTSLKYKDELLQALVGELHLQKSYLGGETIETISSLHTVSANTEITLEANPDDLDQNKIKSLRQTPVNRLSIGIQSFFD